MQYCAINEQVTTCEAVLAELKETYCGDGGNNGEGNADITKCPQDAGALCEDVIGQKRCTYGCDENSDCEFGCTASGYCL